MCVFREKRQRQDEGESLTCASKVDSQAFACRTLNVSATHIKEHHFCWFHFFSLLYSFHFFFFAFLFCSSACLVSVSVPVSRDGPLFAKLRTMLRTFLVLVSGLAACKGNLQDKPWQNRSLPVEQRVALLLPTLTVEQKIAQTFATHTGQDVVRQFKHTGVGAAKYLSAFPGNNVTAAIEQRNQMQQEFLDSSNIPVAFINEGLHGGAPGGTIFPMPVSQGCSWNVSLVQSIAAVIAAEARAIGVDTVFAPVVNMMVDPRFGRLQEGFSENPLVTSHMGRASVLGLQNGAKQDAYLGNASVASLGKHYAAYGAAMGGLNGGPAEITKRMLFDVFLRPWKAMSEAGLRSCMPSHNTALSVPCHGSEYLIDTVLRKQFGFSNGVALSDCNDIGVLVDFRVAANVSHAAAIALKAGVDWDLQCGTDPAQWSYNQLNESLAAGLIGEDDLDATVSRVLAHKFASGLFDNGPADPEAAVALLDNGAHRQLAREAAEQSAVLLINKGDNALPLPRDLSSLSVALLGPTASSECNCSDAADSVVGSYTLSGAHVVTLDEALRNASAQVQWAAGMASGGGATGTGTDAEKLAEAVALAKTADVSILVLGDIQGGCGEWGDRDDLDLQGGQLQLLEAVAAVSKKTIAILVHGRPQTFGPDNAVLVRSAAAVARSELARARARVCQLVKVCCAACFASVLLTVGACWCFCFGAVLEQR